MQFPELAEVLGQLEEMRDDGLLEINHTVRVTEQGKAFVQYLYGVRFAFKTPSTESRIFSMTI
jgi:oxygen-independent coproporphyrinogen-3 oxidase